MRKARWFIAVLAVLFLMAVPAGAGQDAPGLGIRAEDFQARFNEAAIRVKSSIQAQNIEIKPNGTGKMMRVRFSPAVNLWGLMDPVGQLSQVAMLFKGGEKDDASRFIVCAVILVEMCAPDLDQKGCMALLKEMGFFDPDRQKGESVRDGVRYSFSKELGNAITFGVAAI